MTSTRTDSVIIGGHDGSRRCREAFVAVNESNVGEDDFK